MSEGTAVETKVQTVRAKFKCHGMEKNTGWNGAEFHYSYRFSPVVTGSPENERFYAATPSGDLRLSALRSDLFEVGKEYYLDFSLAI